MLLPKKTKYRKQQRGRRAGVSKGQTRVQFGDFGLKSMEAAWVTNRQIEAARIAMTRKIKRGGKVWINKGEIMPEGFDSVAQQKETRLGDQDTARRRGGRTEGLSASRESGRNRSQDREGLGPVRPRRPRRSGARRSPKQDAPAAEAPPEETQAPEAPATEEPKPTEESGGES